MPKARDSATKPAIQKDGKVRAMLTVTAAECAAIDRARGSIPFATWVRDQALRAAAKEKK